MLELLYSYYYIVVHFNTYNVLENIKFNLFYIVLSYFTFYAYI